MANRCLIVYCSEHLAFKPKCGACNDALKYKAENEEASHPLEVTGWYFNECRELPEDWWSHQRMAAETEAHNKAEKATYDAWVKEQTDKLKGDMMRYFQCNDRHGDKFNLVPSISEKFGLIAQVNVGVGVCLSPDKVKELRDYLNEFLGDEVNVSVEDKAKQMLRQANQQQGIISELSIDKLNQHMYNAQQKIKGLEDKLSALDKVNTELQEQICRYRDRIEAIEKSSETKKREAGYRVVSLCRASSSSHDYYRVLGFSKCPRCGC